jgi:hypothetical protein
MIHELWIHTSKHLTRTTSSIFADLLCYTLFCRLIHLLIGLTLNCLLHITILYHAAKILCTASSHNLLRFIIMSGDIPGCFPTDHLGLLARATFHMPTAGVTSSANLT